MNGEQEFDYLNVIPLVDVMLVLLTIVLTTSTFIATGSIAVNLPKADEGEMASTASMHTVVVDKSGAIWLDDRKLALADLPAAMRGFNRQTPVLLRADRDLPLQGFVDVYECVKKQGFAALSLQTEQP